MGNTPLVLRFILADSMVISLLINLTFSHGLQKNHNFLQDGSDVVQLHRDNYIMRDNYNTKDA